MENNYTKRKWVANLDGAHSYIDGGIGTKVLAICNNPFIPEKENEANAEHIVKCVNSHDEIMQKLHDWLFTLFDFVENNNIPGTTIENIISEIKELQNKAK